MILVKTKIGKSNIDGIGIFAGQFIAKGTPVWRFCPGFDLKMSEKDLECLSEPAKQQFLKYAYLNKDGTYILCSDDARFFNHSDNPNCGCAGYSGDDSVPDIALRDIKTGEELTCDYKSFDGDFEFKLKI